MCQSVTSPRQWKSNLIIEHMDLSYEFRKYFINLAKCFDHIMKIMKVGQKVKIYFKYFSYDPYIICMKFGTFLMSLRNISYN